MKTAQSLAEFLGADDLRPPEALPGDNFDNLEDLTGQEFCKKVLESREFRQYVMNCITLGDVPPWLGARLCDHAWGKPPDKLELTGKDGNPIEQVTEIRRVIVHVEQQPAEAADSDTPQITH